MDTRLEVKRAGLAKYNHQNQTNNNNHNNIGPADAMALLKENKQLKSMLLLHLNVIQEQNDMLVAKDKQIAALQGKLDRLERKYAGLKLPPSVLSPVQGDENTPGANNTPGTVVGVVPASAAGQPTTMSMASVRPAVQQFSRGTIMKMAALNQTATTTTTSSGKGQLRIRPLMISLKKITPAVIEQHQSSMQVVAMDQQENPNQAWNQFLTAHKIKIEPDQIKGENITETKSTANLIIQPNTTTTTTITTPVEYTNGKGIAAVPAVKEENEVEGDDEESELLLMDTDSQEIIVSDGSPMDMPMELKLDEDDDLLSPVKHQPKEDTPDVPNPTLVVDIPPPQITIKVEPESSSQVEPLTRESLAKAMRFDTLTVHATKRSPSECSNRAPRKYSRVMSTRKLYVTRHWEEREEDAEEPNSLVVPELREGESNLEVPNWKEIDAQGLEAEVRAEDAPKQVVATEDLSAAAFLKRHSKHEADERRRKKWDIQRFREQRTIEKLKKRQCKSDVYSIGGLSGSGGGGGGGGMGMQLAQCVEDPANVAWPMSLYPSLNSIRHVETTEYLPVQAFGEPIPTLHHGEFDLPWRGAGGDAGASVELTRDEGSGQHQVGVGNLLQSGECSSSSNKYSSFYVKQSSSLMPMRLSSSSGSSKYRFKRVKSQGSSSGRR